MNVQPFYSVVALLLCACVLLCVRFDLTFPAISPIPMLELRWVEQTRVIVLVTL